MSATTGFGPRLDVRGWFAQDRARLAGLLRTLTASDWGRTTAAAPWTVREVVAHMLGDDVNRLSRSRDGHTGDGPAPGESLPAFIHRINAEWVRATSRISPEVLLELFEVTTRQVVDFWSASDLDAVGEPVTWASSDPAPVWLDCARDFTEYWVHHQQIREATGRWEPEDPGVVHAVLETFLRAVPHTFAGCAHVDGTSLAVRVDGAGGGRWAWRWEGGLPRPTDHDAACATEIGFDDGGTLWRLCTRMITPAEARRRVVVEGDHEIADRLLRIVAIIR